MQPAERLRRQALAVALYYGATYVALLALAILAVGGFYGFLWVTNIVLPWFVLAAVLTGVILVLARNQPWKGAYFDAAIATALGVVLGFFVLIASLLLMSRWGR